MTPYTCKCGGVLYDSSEFVCFDCGARYVVPPVEHEFETDIRETNDIDGNRRQLDETQWCVIHDAACANPATASRAENRERGR